jgi:hypothetical protein
LHVWNAHLKEPGCCALSLAFRQGIPYKIHYTGTQLDPRHYWIFRHSRPCLSPGDHGGVGFSWGLLWSGRYPTGSQPINRRLPGGGPGPSSLIDHATSQEGRITRRFPARLPRNP